MQAIRTQKGAQEMGSCLKAGRWALEREFVTEKHIGSYNGVSAKAGKIARLLNQNLEQR